ncbi:MAG: hypothetical protein ABJC66_17620 [Gammaproteobacteria bacterium]
MSTASLLLPLTAVPESHIQTAPPAAAVSAAGHVDFKIIIPKVLSLDMGDSNRLALDGATVSIMSNGHNVSLNATEHTASTSAHTSALSHSGVILSAAARKGIAQSAQCRLGSGRAAAAPAPARGTSAGDSRATICTVSMP